MGLEMLGQCLDGNLEYGLELSTFAIPPVAIVIVNQVHVKQPTRSRMPIVRDPPSASFFDRVPLCWFDRLSMCPCSWPPFTSPARSPSPSFGMSFFKILLSLSPFGVDCSSSSVVVRPIRRDRYPADISRTCRTREL